MSDDDRDRTGARNGDGNGAIEIPLERLVDIILTRATLDDVGKELSETATPEQIEAALSRVSADQLNASFRERAERVADSFLEEARAPGPDEDEEGFLRRHRARWRESLAIAKAFLDYNVGLGHDINTAERPRAVETQNAKFEALIRNHARICRIGKEALCLAANGYAAGALARWRTMHEIAVVCLFLRQNDAELSRRYLLYDAVDSQKSAKAHDEHADALMCVRPTEEELQAVNDARKALETEFGKEFSALYGWAHGYVTGRPDFHKLQKAVLPQWLPRYKLACDEVHASAKPLYFNLSAGPQRDILLVGPSDQGLPEAVHPVLLSTNMVMGCLVAEFPSNETTFCGLVLDAMAARAGEALIREFANESAPPPPAVTTDSKARVEYLKWSCDQLVRMLDGEHGRRASIRRDTHASMFLLPLLVGFGIHGMRSPVETGMETALLALLLLVAGAATFCWYRAMRVEALPAFNEDAFTQHEGTVAEHDYEDRYLKKRDYLMEAVKNAKRMGTAAAQWRKWCLRLAVVAITVALLLLATRI